MNVNENLTTIVSDESKLDEKNIKADDTTIQDKNQENLNTTDSLLYLENKEEDSEDIENNSENDSKTDQDDEIVVTIGDETLPSTEETTTPPWVKEVRKTNRKLKREVRELQEKLKERSNKESDITLGKKPLLEDVDYDTELYDRKLQEWYETKIKVDQQKAKKQEQQKVQEQLWQDRVNKYTEAKNKLNVIDYDEAEFNVQELLSPTQQGMIIEGADNPELVIYALGKNPKKLKELSQINQPVKFAFTVSKLETQLKVANKRKPNSTPEKILRNSSGNANAMDSTLERLREEASKTGDYTKVLQYKKNIKSKGIRNG